MKHFVRYKFINNLHNLKKIKLKHSYAEKHAYNISAHLNNKFINSQRLIFT